MLTGLTAIITGASGTVGRGIVDAFLAAGAACVRQHHRGDLPVVDRPTSDVAVDLTQPGAPNQLIAAALDLGGQLDCLVNVAGVQPVHRLPEMTEEDWRAVIEVNLTATHRLSRAAADVMAGQDRGGSIVHIASIEGHQPAVGHAHYAVSKAALLMHARAMALEYGPHGVRVNTISPGLIDRPGLAGEWPDGHTRWMAAVPLGRLGRPADIAAACVFFSSTQARWISGTDLVVDGGMSARPTW